VDDHDLLEAARRGDRGALETFLERHQARVLRFGLKMCRDAEDARDVAQETLLAAARGLSGFRAASSPSTWLYTIARSFCIKARRRSKFAPTVSSADGEARRAVEAVPADTPPPDEALAEARLSDALWSAIAALEPKYREVLLLRDVEGLSAAEVGEVTGLGVPAVKSRLHRARMQVRDRLAPHLGRATRPGAACEDVARLFSRHLEGEIDAATCARMERHLEGCGDCRAACDSLKQVLRLCRSGSPAEVPAELQDSVRAGLRQYLRQR
jgi:RNA polymerase sigma-70 factor (ECF subfamily)